MTSLSVCRGVNNTQHVVREGRRIISGDGVTRRGASCDIRRRRCEKKQLFERAMAAILSAIDMA